MTGTATTDGRKAGGQEAAHPPAAGIVALGAAVQFGGTFFGVAVASMTLVLVDGREVKIDLILPAAADGRRLTAAESAVLEVVENMPPGTVWSVAQIVDRAGYSVTTEIRRYIRSLSHLLIEHTHGWERAKERCP